MALLAHSFLPGSLFDIDPWTQRRPMAHACRRRPFLLEVLDPFSLSSSYEKPKVPRKFRVSLDCQGFSPESIKTEIKDGKLIVTGSEGNKPAADSSDGDFSLRQFRKSYELPEGAEVDKLVRFMTDNGKLVVEIPLKEADEAKQVKPTQRNDGFPQIVENGKGEKSVSIKLDLPKSIDPAKLSVTCKDRDLIVKGENVVEHEDSFSKTYFYKRMTLPEEADFSALKCVCENKQLSFSAPLLEESPQQKKKIRIEYKDDNVKNQIDQ